MERYWAFACCEYEGGVGLDDLVGTYATKTTAIKMAETGEWGAVFDSKTNKQSSHQYKQWDLFEDVLRLNQDKEVINDKKRG